MTPSLTITEVANKQFVAALAEEDDDFGIRLVVNRPSPVTLHYELELISEKGKSEGDIEVLSGSVKFWIAEDSCELIDGTEIDFQTGTNGAGFKFTNPNDIRHKKWADPIAAKFQDLLDREINPGIAAHQGFITLVEYKDGVAVVYMGGGCQGCGQAAATLREGVEAKVKAEIPEIIEIVDMTDHDQGSNPYY
ncbi:MAG: NifU family protein [Kofleriaceae bacterium]|nr:NifU family protein [Kofleriaceae bacterium]